MLIARHYLSMKKYAHEYSLAFKKQKKTLDKKLKYIWEGKGGQVFRIAVKI